MTSSCKIGVLGVGNVLMGDDGIGPFVVKVLEARFEFPQHVSLEDLGTPGLGITPFLSDYKAIILIDAVSAKGRPGDVKLYRKDELIHLRIQPRVSPHDPALVEALLFAELSGKCPSEVLLVGVVPESSELSCSLSVAARQAVEPAMEAVLVELRRLGIEPLPRTQPAAPAIWWDAAASSDPLTGEPYVPSDTR
jgi:hydrogenase maturation protease